MSTPSARPAKATRRVADSGPMIGALLRLAREAIVARMFEALEHDGLDLTLTELRVFLYPGPDGRRPADLARQCGMTRQAMNYVLSGLEERGYLERRVGTHAASRVVRMTARGRDVMTAMRHTVATVEREWSAQLGERRFRALRDTLVELCQWLGNLDPVPPEPSRDQGTARARGLRAPRR